MGLQGKCVECSEFPLSIQLLLRVAVPVVYEVILCKYHQHLLVVQCSGLAYCTNIGYFYVVVNLGVMV